jgi:hypothetical protein
MSSWRQKQPAIPDPKLSRPKTRAAAISQIRAVFDETKWDASEQNHYLASLGLPAGDIGALNNDDLRIILNDFEAGKMILYAEEKQTERTVEKVI